MRWSAVAAVALAVVGCAHDVNKWYLGKVTGDKTGTVVVKFSEVVSNASVTVNDKEVCSDEQTGRVTVNGIPAGKNTIHVVASDPSWEKNIDLKQDIQVPANQKTTVQISTPVRGTGYWVYMAVVGGVLVAFILFM